jgi:hypothetical protein
MSSSGDSRFEIPVHTSDRLSFKGCRERWNFLSDIRMGYKPIETPRPFEFGSAFHSAMQWRYNPPTWHLRKTPHLLEGSIQAFRNSMADSKKRYLRLKQMEALDPEDQEKYLVDLDLGEGMLRHYFEWVELKGFDDYITPIGVEIGFSVPIFDSLEEQDDLLPHMRGFVIVYRGRIDLIVIDQDGRLWILDHKTASRFRDNLGHLEMDEQLGSYNWGFERQTGRAVAGNIYSEVYKAYPVPPTENSTVRLGRRFSVNKNQATSYEVYKQHLIANNEPLELYEDFLNYLKLEAHPYVRRTQVHRSQTELRLLHERIKAETLDMFDPGLRIYPHPGPFKCEWCPMRPPCLAKMEGQDFQWILDTNYVKEKRTNA